MELGKTEEKKSYISIESLVNDKPKSIEKKLYVETYG
jgi:hypothetical protein